MGERAGGTPGSRYPEAVSGLWGIFPGAPRHTRGGLVRRGTMQLGAGHQEQGFGGRLVSAS